MDLIVKYVPYTLKSFLFEHPLSLTLAALGLIIFSLKLKQFIHLLKLCKKAGIKYKEVKDVYIDDIIKYIDFTDEKELKKLELSNAIKFEKDELEHYKVLQHLKKEVPDARLNMIMASLSLFLLIQPLIFTVSIDFLNDFDYRQPANLIEIKDHIKIDNDKLTIENLPDAYQYKNKELRKNQLHDFKIVKNEFYRDDDIKLVDKTNKEYTISKSELDELTRK